MTTFIVNSNGFVNADDLRDYITAGIKETWKHLMGDPVAVFNWDCYLTVGTLSGYIVNQVDGTWIATDSLYWGHGSSATEAIQNLEEHKEKINGQREEKA